MGKRFVLVCAAVAALSTTASAQTRFFSGEITAGTITAESHGVSGAIATFDLAGPGFHLVGTGVGVILSCISDSISLMPARPEAPSTHRRSSPKV